MLVLQSKQNINFHLNALNSASATCKALGLKTFKWDFALGGDEI